MGTTGRQANCSWQQRRKGGGVMVFFWFRSGRGCDPGLPLCRGGLPLCGCASCAFCALSWSCGGGAGNGELAGLEEQPKWKREVRIKGVIQYVMRWKWRVETDASGRWITDKHQKFLKPGKMRENGSKRRKVKMCRWLNCFLHTEGICFISHWVDWAPLARAQWASHPLTASV